MMHITQGDLHEKMDGWIAVAVRMKGWVRPTGSRVTTHYNTWSDYDYIILDVEGNVEKAVQGMPSTWQRGGSDQAGKEAEGERFHSYKAFNDRLNFIITQDRDFFEKYLTATELIRVVDPPDKKGRIALFNQIFDKAGSDTMVPF